MEERGGSQAEEPRGGEGLCSRAGKRLTCVAGLMLLWELIPNPQQLISLG